MLLCFTRGGLIKRFFCLLSLKARERAHFKPGIKGVKSHYADLSSLVCMLGELSSLVTEFVEDKFAAVVLIITLESGKRRRPCFVSFPAFPEAENGNRERPPKRTGNWSQNKFSHDLRKFGGIQTSSTLSLQNRTKKEQRRRNLGKHTSKNRNKTIILC